MSSFRHSFSTVTIFTSVRLQTLDTGLYLELMLVKVIKKANFSPSARKQVLAQKIFRTWRATWFEGYLADCGSPRKPTTTAGRSRPLSFVPTWKRVVRVEVCARSKTYLKLFSKWANHLWDLGCRSQGTWSWSVVTRAEHLWANEPITVFLSSYSYRSSCLVSEGCFGFVSFCFERRHVLKEVASC